MKYAIALMMCLAVTCGAQVPVESNKVTTFHNCSLIGEGANDPQPFDVSERYRCDEGDIQIDGKTTMVIERGWLYETSLGRPSLERPHIADEFDYTRYKWCASPIPEDPNRKVMCGVHQGKP
jgi:hypothetical protein